MFLGGLTTIYMGYFIVSLDNRAHIKQVAFLRGVALCDLHTRGALDAILKRECIKAAIIGPGQTQKSNIVLLFVKR